ncbi:hypothetical protein K458DRAFT_381344 [Lentithecium fluviatile CBS 122367]|uniref:Uncharacterized protein n=1 Tax=Lentithecium fluviatile CBS 122367 TaxID=1168545 RepID=A0A6G1JMW2_9PLEO|nr:hypothetical protein K458DRAFT_381344 [Lentithecium fluviatile CBS 122367]
MRARLPPELVGMVYTQYWALCANERFRSSPGSLGFSWEEHHVQLTGVEAARDAVLNLFRDEERIRQDDNQIDILRLSSYLSRDFLHLELLVGHAIRRLYVIIHSIREDIFGKYAPSRTTMDDLKMQLNALLHTPRKQGLRLTFYCTCGSSILGFEQFLEFFRELYFELKDGGLTQVKLYLMSKFWDFHDYGDGTERTVHDYYHSPLLQWRHKHGLDEAIEKEKEIYKMLNTRRRWQHNS